MKKAETPMEIVLAQGKVNKAEISVLLCERDIKEIEEYAFFLKEAEGYAKSAIKECKKIF